MTVPKATQVVRSRVRFEARRRLLDLSVSRVETYTELMPSNPHQYYDSFADEILAKFQRISQLVGHGPTTGDYHEEILRVVLRNFLSKRFSVKKGFVYKNEGEVSSQVDILIVDEYQASAYIYQDGDFAIVRPRAVVAAIEVKTTLRAGDFDVALANIASVKRLTERPNDICGMIFGYDGANPRPSTLDTWFQRESAVALKDTPLLGPTLFAFFRHGVLLQRYNPANSTIDDGTNYHVSQHFSVVDPLPDPVGEGWQLRVILAVIYAVCERQEMNRTHTFSGYSDANELLKFSGAVVSQDSYELGVGSWPHSP